MWQERARRECCPPCASLPPHESNPWRASPAGRASGRWSGEACPAEDEEDEEDEEGSLPPAHRAVSLLQALQVARQFLLQQATGLSSPSSNEGKQPAVQVSPEDVCVCVCVPITPFLGRAQLQTDTVGKYTCEHITSIFGMAKATRSPQRVKSPVNLQKFTGGKGG